MQNKHLNILMLAGTAEKLVSITAVAGTDII
jgi:hypothetical protein